jgi:hypothetical protein
MYISNYFYKLVYVKEKAIKAIKAIKAKMKMLLFLRRFPLTDIKISRGKKNKMGCPALQWGFGSLF